MFGQATGKSPKPADKNARPTWQRFLGGALCSIFLSASLASGVPEPTNFKFDFGSGKVAPGYMQVLPTTVYTQELGYGIDLASKVSAVDRGGDDALRSDFCTSDRPFFFSVKVPEGNYQVTVLLGDPSGATTNTIKAESRRLMLKNVVTAPGKFETRTFTVNVRTPRIASGGQVRLKTRESGPPPVLHWDDKLTLEFNGARPCVCALEIARVENATTIYLAGDASWKRSERTGAASPDSSQTMCRPLIQATPILWEASLYRPARWPPR